MTNRNAARRIRKPNKVTKMTNYSDFLISNGVVDSRAFPLRAAMKELFSAYCALDLGQRAQFDSIVADRCLRDAVIQFAETENGCNTQLDTHVKRGVK